MPYRLDRRLTGLVLGLALAVSLSACGGKRPPVLATTPGGEGGPAPADAYGPPPTQPIDEGPDVRAMEGESALGADIAGAYDPTAEASPLGDVRFDYDSAVLTEEARATLEQHALWLQGRRGVKVIVEGHCDERGTVEYNLALGEQRARAARDYLVGLGVAEERLRTVSYGKERPLDPGSNEAAWARNRRAHFALTR